MLPFTFDEPPVVIFEAVPDLRMPVDVFFVAVVCLTATLWVVEALMDAMMKLVFVKLQRPEDYFNGWKRVLSAVVEL